MRNLEMQQSASTCSMVWFTHTCCGEDWSPQQPWMTYIMTQLQPQQPPFSMAPACQFSSTRRETTRGKSVDHSHSEEGKLSRFQNFPTALPLFALLYLQARTLLPYQVVQQVQAPVCLVNVWPPNTSGWTRSVTEKTNGAVNVTCSALHASKQSS